MSSRKRSASYLDSNPKKYTKRVVKKVGPSNESYKVKSKASTMSSRNLGLSRVWNVIAPAFKIKQNNYYPRSGDFASLGDPAGVVTQFPRVTELSTFAAAAGKQAMFEIPHMSCFEWLTLSQKCLDNTAISATEPYVGNLTGQAVIARNVSLDKHMMLEYCKYKYEFVNTQLCDSYIEITEVQPIRAIMDQIVCTNVVNSAVDLNQVVVNTTQLDSSPLSCMYKDFQRQKSQNNARVPIDSTTNYTKSDAEQLLGYNTKGSAFYKHYKVLSKKVFKLGPGSKVNYEMSIPAFRAKSSFSIDEVSFDSSTIAQGATYTQTYSIQPSMWEKSKWMVIRVWSGKVSTTANTSVLGVPPAKIKCIASKSLSIRPIPAQKRPDVWALQPNQFDAFGTMANSTAMPAIAVADARFIDEADDEVVSMAAI